MLQNKFFNKKKSNSKVTSYKLQGFVVVIDDTYILFIWYWWMSWVCGLSIYTSAWGM